MLAAPWRAAAHSPEIFGCLPRAAFLALFSALVSRRAARARSLAGLFDVPVAASSMRCAARSNFLVTRTGTAAPAHYASWRPPSRTQRGAVQSGNVVVVCPGFGDVDVVVAAFVSHASPTPSWSLSF